MLQGQYAMQTQMPKLGYLVLILSTRATFSIRNGRIARAIKHIEEFERICAVGRADSVKPSQRCAIRTLFRQTLLECISSNPFLGLSIEPISDCSSRRASR